MRHNRRKKLRKQQQRFGIASNLALSFSSWINNGNLVYTDVLFDRFNLFFHHHHPSFRAEAALRQCRNMCFFKTLFINIPRGAILKPSAPTSSNEWNSLFLSFFFSCFEIVNFPDLSWIWILPPFRIKNVSKSKNLYSKIRIPRFYSQIKLFDLTATKPHTNTHTCIYKDTKKIEIQRIERN